MSGSASRARKYSLKTVGDISKIRTDRYRDVQAPAFSSAVGNQVKIERLVKRILEANTIMVSLNHFYMNFGKKLDKIRRNHSGATAQLEACIEFEKWSSRGLDNATLDEIVTEMGFENCWTAPPACAWDWKRKLTFSGNIATSNLDNFPVLVHLTNANFDFAKAQAAGQDIRFMDSDTCPSDGTPLKHEIEHWDAPGENAWVWVKVPRIDGSSVTDFIYMFYGNAAAPDGQDAVNVWDANFVSVWHMKGDGTTTIPDSTTANNGTKKAIGEPANVTDNFDGCQEYDGDDYITIGGDASLDIAANICVEYWIYVPSSEVGYGDMYALAKGVVANYNYKLYPNAGPANVSFWGNITGRALINTAADYLFNTWYHVAYTYDGTGQRIYVNGAQAAVDGSTGNANLTDPLLLGKLSGYAPNAFVGRQDEVRISNTHRSGDWVMATYRSGAGLLITYGAEIPA